MQMLVTCTAQEPLVIVENKEGDQNREPLKKKVFFSSRTNRTSFMPRRSVPLQKGWKRIRYWQVRSIRWMSPSASQVGRATGRMNGCIRIRSV